MIDQREIAEEQLEEYLQKIETENEELKEQNELLKEFIEAVECFDETGEHCVRQTKKYDKRFERIKW